MVDEEEVDGEEAYLCESCGLHYREKEHAVRCEEHHMKEGRCNLKLAKNSIERGD